MANSFYVTAGSVGVTSPGGCAIFGDNPVPYAAGGTIGAGDSLTTGDLVAGDAGEMGGLNEFAVEYWYQINGTLPGSNTYISQGPESSNVGFVEWAVQYITAGSTLQFEVKDNAATYHTCGSSGYAIAPGVFNHFVFTAQGGSLWVYVNGVARGQDASWGSHTVQSMRGVAGSAYMALTQSLNGYNQYWDEVAVYRSGLTAARVLEHYNAGVNRGWKAQVPGERMNAALDVVGNHAPRAIDSGIRSVVPRYMTGQAPIEELRFALESDDADAGLFIAADGTITFLAANHRSIGSHVNIQATFGDGAGELPYADLTLDYSEAFLINEWNITRTPYQQNIPVTQTASDATSISRYFKRSQSLSDYPGLSDSDASAVATALLAKYKDPMQRVTSISFTTGDINTAEELFRRELMDKIRILRTPPGGGSRIQQDVFIQKIEISGANDGVPWTVTWAVSPL